MTHRACSWYRGPPKEARWKGSATAPAHGPAAPQPCSVSGGGAAAAAGGGAEGGALAAGGRHFLLQHSVVSPPSSSACPQRPRGPGQAWGSLGEGASQTGPGKCTLRFFVLGWGVLGAAKGADWLPWRPGRGLGGVEGAPCLPAWALPLLNQRLRFRSVGMGRKGRSPSPGTSGARGCAGTGAEGVHWD